VAAARREVIDAGHVLRRTGHRAGQAEGQPQQRAAVHRDTQRSGQPHPGLPASSSATWDSNPCQRLPGTVRLSIHQPKAGLTEFTMGGIVGQ
jgi:hypothetical protein